MKKVDEKKMVTLECEFCGEEFQREKKNIKKDQERFFCSRECITDSRRGSWNMHV